MQMQENARVQALQRFLSGRLFLAVLTALVILSQAFALDMVGITALCLTVAAVCLFGKDTTPAIPAACLILFNVSLKHSPWAPASSVVLRTDIVSLANRLTILQAVRFGFSF